MERYHEVSSQVMEILQSYTPLVEQISVDEAFMDVSGCEALFGDAMTIGRTMVNRIEQELGLTASVGIAPNKFLAKLASDLQKPRGFVVVKEGEIHQLLDPLPVNKLWGVGPKTDEALRRMGIETIGVLRTIPLDKLRKRLGEMGEHLYRLANGWDDRPVQTPEDAKSIGHETTFQQDSDDREFLQSVLLSLAERVARRLRQSGVQGWTVNIKIRDADFKTITRSRRLLEPTDYEETIYQTALELANEARWGGGKRIRLLGVSLSQLTDQESQQISLFTGNEPTELRELHQAIDALKDRYGEQIIIRAGTALKKRKTNNSEEI
jgi:DNA polymerase-4